MEEVSQKAILEKNTTTIRDWLLPNKWLIGLVVSLVLVSLASMAILAVFGLLISPWLVIPCVLLLVALFTGGKIFYHAKRIQAAIDAFKKIDFDANKFINENIFLGLGGFSTVYRGIYDNQRVAIKKLKDTKIEDFSRETLIIAKLTSPYLVKFVTASLRQKNIVMEYIEGTNLARLLTASNCPNWKTGLYQIGLDITCGLQHLHALHIIHCDLKTANVLVNSNFRAKITDFGQSKIVKSELSDSTQLLYHDRNCGTPAWVAPEVFYSSEDKMSKASDMYSYGCILWALGAKKEPLAKEITEDISRGKVKIQDKEKATEDTPQEMKKLIQFCWSNDPSQRPTIENAAKQLKEESAQFLENPAL